MTIRRLILKLLLPTVDNGKAVKRCDVLSYVTESKGGRNKVPYTFAQMVQNELGRMTHEGIICRPTFGWYTLDHSFDSVTWDRTRRKVGAFTQRGK